MADRLDADDVDLALAGLQDFLPGAMALDLGRGRVHAQQFEGDAKAHAVVEGHFEHPRLLVHGDFGRLRGVFSHGGRGSQEVEMGAASASPVSKSTSSNSAATGHAIPRSGMCITSPAASGCSTQSPSALRT